MHTAADGEFRTRNQTKEMHKRKFRGQEGREKRTAACRLLDDGQKPSKAVEESVGRGRRREFVAWQRT
jgi:hypothetical protein